MIFNKSCILDLRVVRATPEKIVTKEDLQKTVEITLTETETLSFFNLPTVLISVESEEAGKVMYVWLNCLFASVISVLSQRFLALFLFLGIPG